MDIMDIEEILAESKNVDTKAAAEEILSWLQNNVENYIDNQTKLYKIDLIIDSDEMPMTKKLQDLYRAIPEDSVVAPTDDSDTEETTSEASDCRRELDKVVEEVYDKMADTPELMNGLFRRLIFFYEKIIPNPENRKRAIEIDEELKSLIEGKEDAPDAEKKEIQEQIIELIKEGESLVKYEEFEGAVLLRSLSMKLSA